MTIYFEKETAEKMEIDCEQIAGKVIETVLEYFQCPCETCVSVYLVEEETIRNVNRETRGIDRVTDVLSFPNIPFEREGDFAILEKESEHYAYFEPDTEELILGEIMLCQKKIIEQAEEYGHSVLREYVFLLTHSMLHLLGYDHMEDGEREKMEEEQRKILELLAVARD